MTTATVRPCTLPADALLGRLAGSGAYMDCYVTEIEGAVSLARYVEAFYTTALFKVERSILRFAASRPSSDTEARRLAQGQLDGFAAWRVEGRTPDQLLLADFTGRTKSWLMVAAAEGAGPRRTRLYFGSAVLPKRADGTGRAGLGFVFSALLGFHRVYSRALLSAARSRLARQAGAAPARGDA